MGIMRSKQLKSSEKGKQNRGRRISLRSLKQEYELCPSRSFIVRFAGRMETSTPGGENIDDCLLKLYKKVHNVNSLPRVCLEISSSDLIIRKLQLEPDVSQEEILIPVGRISFVVADKKHQLFAFNDLVSQKPRRIECYAFICNESEKSDVVANALSEAFRGVHERSRGESSLVSKWRAGS